MVTWGCKLRTNIGLGSGCCGVPCSAPPYHDGKAPSTSCSPWAME